MSAWSPLGLRRGTWGGSVDTGTMAPAVSSLKAATACSESRAKNRAYVRRKPRM